MRSPSSSRYVLSAAVLLSILFILYLSSSIAILRSDPVTYLPFTFGYASLLQSLEAYEHAGWKNIVIVDNSPAHVAWTRRQQLFSRFPSVERVTTTPVQLRFSQLQAHLDHLALESNAEVYLWAHTDALLLSNSTAYSSMLECLEWARSENMGTMFFEYDLLNAVFTSPASVAPWDVAMPQYGADCDRYRRLRIAGYEVGSCPIPIGKVVHLHHVLSREQRDELWSMDTVEEQEAYLGELNQSDWFKYRWREMAVGNKAAMDSERQGGKLYIQEKWGLGLQNGCGNFDGVMPKW